MIIRVMIITGVLAAALASAPARLCGQARQSDATIGEPIRCWWRTSVSAVTIGEPFEATVTCAVPESDVVRVVPDESRLEPTSIQLAPFEVLGGSHPADLRSSTHRFFQYRYSVRIIAPDIIGRDAKFPDIQLHYRLHDRVAGETVEGRDRIYLLPGQPIRVLSQVPLEADDIRDSSDADFSAVTALQFRARAFRLAALVLVLSGLVVLASVVVRLARGRNPARRLSASPVSPRAALGQAVAELREIKLQSAGTWTADLIARTAGAERVVAAIGLGYPVAQHRQARGTPGPPGSLPCTRGWLRKDRYAVSSSITPNEIARRLVQLPSMPSNHRAALEDIQRSLAVHTRALYGSASEIDGSALDEAMSAGLAAAQQLRRAQARPGNWIRSRTLGQSAEAEA